MARPRSPILTDGELRIMNLLWEHGPATVKELHARLSSSGSLAYTTVLSALQTLTGKGAVGFEKRGRAHRYFARLERHEARRNAVRYILGRFFAGSADSLLLNVVEHEAIEPETLERIRRRLDESDPDTDG